MRKWIIKEKYTIIWTCFPVLAGVMHSFLLAMDLLTHSNGSYFRMHLARMSFLSIHSSRSEKQMFCWRGWSTHRETMNDTCNGIYFPYLAELFVYCLFTCRFSGGIISDISYGHRIESFDDPFFSIAEGLGRMVHDGGSPSLLDIHPICKLDIPISAFIFTSYFSRILTIMGPWSIVR
jgi:hypothetical protein